MLARIRSRPWLQEVLAHGLTTLGLLAMLLGTSQTFGPAGRRGFLAVVIAVAGWLMAELLIRLWMLPRPRLRRAYLRSPEGLIDLAAALALPVGWLVVPDARDVPLLAVVWALRYVRHSAGLMLFWRVIRRSSTALLSIACLFLLVFLTAATLAYVFERHAQPDAFGSVPRAMWWAIVTLTTTGYGDVVPLTVWGRLLGGWVMVGGIVTFTLQAGIIATAFAEELQRRHFLHTWDLVIAVPFFQGLGAAAIADIVRLMHARDVMRGATIVRQGEPGDAMYFIVSGEVRVELAPEPVLLGPGRFFGEMALLFGTPRSATVLATKPSVLLALDIADFRELAGRRPEIVDVIEAEGKRRRDENIARADLPS